MFTECCEWTDGADAEMELVKPGMKGEAGAGGRDSGIRGRSLSVCVHIDVWMCVREIARDIHRAPLCVRACASIFWLSVCVCVCMCAYCLRRCGWIHLCTTPCVCVCVWWISDGSWWSGVIPQRWWQQLLVVLSPPRQTDWVLFIKHTGSLMLQGPVPRRNRPTREPGSTRAGEGERGSWGVSGCVMGLTLCMWSCEHMCIYLSLSKYVCFCLSVFALRGRFCISARLSADLSFCKSVCVSLCFGACMHVCVSLNRWQAARIPLVRSYCWNSLLSHPSPVPRLNWRWQLWMVQMRQASVKDVLKNAYVRLYVRGKRSHKCLPCLCVYTWVCICLCVCVCVCMCAREREYEASWRSSRCVCRYL